MYSYFKMKVHLYNIINYIFSYDVDWWIPKFEYKDTEEGYWKIIKIDIGSLNFIIVTERIYYRYLYIERY